jgi:hypothetical protein
VAEEDAGSPADQVAAVRLVDAVDDVRADVDMAATMGAKCDRERICAREEGVARDDALLEDRETDRPAVPVYCEGVPRDDHIPVPDQVFAMEAFAERRPREPVPPRLDRRVGSLEDIVSDRDIVPENVESVCAGAAAARIRIVRPVAVMKPKTLDEVAAHQCELVNPYVGVYGRRELLEVRPIEFLARLDRRPRGRARARSSDEVHLLRHDYAPSAPELFTGWREVAAVGPAVPIQQPCSRWKHDVPAPLLTRLVDRSRDAEAVVDLVIAPSGACGSAGKCADIDGSAVNRIRQDYETGDWVEWNPAHAVT